MTVHLRLPGLLRRTRCGRGRVASRRIDLVTCAACRAGALIARALRRVA